MMKPKHKKLAWMGAVATTLLIIYMIFDPSQYAWFPKCLIRLATGYDCPACGTQRMLHHILHGEFLDALLLNPYMLFVVLPISIILIIGFNLPKGRGERFKRIVAHPICAILLFLLTLGWWILRNTHFWHSFIHNF